MPAAGAKKALVLIDGENVVFRYEEMHRNGRVPLADVRHFPGSFAWSRNALYRVDMLELVRVSYYTHVVGDDKKVADAQRFIAETRYRVNEPGFSGDRQIIPRVRKKDGGSTKQKIVDTEVTMDMMRAAFVTRLDALVLVSGDGDFIPVINDITRSTATQVHVLALSSGLNPGLRSCADSFHLLDDIFFEP
jgi:uncharacterized LabA/DUF88 family protein